MAENEMELYEKLVDMIVAEDFMSGPKTPAFIELMSLQFTKSEARLALKIRTTGGTLSELSEKTGIKADKLKATLLTMADKGTVFYDPGMADPVYRVVKMAAPGFIETGLWCGVKYPYTIELGKAIYKVLQEWSEEKLCKLGFAFAPVWCATKALPADAKPEENLLHVIKGEEHWSVSPCPCRLAHWIEDPGHHCDHILETCIHTGEQSRWCVEHGMGRSLSHKELEEYLEKLNEDGLVHTLNVQHSICNCCDDCCAIFHGEKQGKKVFIPSPFVAEVQEDLCNQCGKCEPRCPASAIEVEETCSIDREKCIGCGVCVTTCKLDGLYMVRRNPETIAA